jgi:hypothetical protein
MDPSRRTPFKVNTKRHSSTSTCPSQTIVIKTLPLGIGDVKAYPLIHMASVVPNFLDIKMQIHVNCCIKDHILMQAHDKSYDKTLIKYPVTVVGIIHNKYGKLEKKPCQPAFNLCCWEEDNVKTTSGLELYRTWVRKLGKLQLVYSIRTNGNKQPSLFRPYKN